MKPTVKYWLFIIAIALAIFAVIGFSFIASWFSLDPADQEIFETLFSKLFVYTAFDALVLFVIIGGMVSLLFRLYIIPILQLSEETRLISSINAGHRIAPRGASEVHQLINTINDYSESFETMKTDVESKIKESQSALNDERNRLAALMSELPNGVLVCNTDGQILLYNPQAQKLLTQAEDKQQKNKPIGLGRSVFALIERNPILHGLDVLQQSLKSGKKQPVTGFMLPLGAQYLRFNMAPVYEITDNQANMTGFVLTIEDIAPAIESGNRLEGWLQGLIDEFETSLLQIRTAITAILSEPKMERPRLATNRQTIDSASYALQKRLSRTREEAARNIHTVSRQEEVLGQHLLHVLSKHLEGRFKIRCTTTLQEDGWVKLDSYITVQGIAFLAGRLKKRAGIEAVDLSLTRSGDTLHLMMSWEHDTVRTEDVDSWQRTALVTDSYQHTFSFRDFIASNEGSLRLNKVSDGTCNGIVVILPLSQLEEEYTTSSDFEERPVFYEFDLFESRSLESLGVMPLRTLTYVPFDLETTGLDPTGGDEMIQLGAIRVVNCKLLHNETMDQLIDPQRVVPPIATEITGITPEMLVGQPKVADVLPEFREFAAHSVLVAHNAAFDMRFLQLKEIETHCRFHNPVLDTLLLSTVVHPNQDDHTLDGIAGRMNIPVVGRHTALGDAIVTAEILVRLIPLLEAQGIVTLADAIKASASSKFANKSF